MTDIQSEKPLDKEIEAVAKVIYESGKTGTDFELALGTLKESVQLWKLHRGFHAATDGEMIIQRIKNVFKLPLDFMYVLSRVINDIDDSIAQAELQGREAERERIRKNLYEHIELNGTDDNGLGWINTIEVEEVIEALSQENTHAE